MSLLNIPDDIRRFGNLRNVWDLSSYCEGFIPFIKPYIRNELAGFTKNVAVYFFQQMAYSDMAEMLVDNDKQSIIHDAAKEYMCNQYSKYLPGFSDMHDSNSSKISSKFEPFRKGGAIDADRNKIPILSLDDLNDLKAHKNIFVPCVVNRVNGDILIVHRTESSQKSLPQYVFFHLDTINPNNFEIGFKCIFFSATDKHVSDCIDADWYFMNTSRFDMISAFLLQHPLKKRYYHVICMDWSELTFDIKQSPFEYKPKFTLHTPHHMLRKVISD